MSRRIAVFVLAALPLVLPTPALAQSAIVGTIKDTSGSVLPGVTVEAASAVLIEGSRTVFTDGEGLYRIENLRPGTYVVTFTLAGFSTFRREGIELPSEFTATINADLRIGALEESITVTGNSPMVDVTTAVHTSVLNREAMDSIPTGRTIQGMGQLIVGVSLNLPDTGGSRAMQQTYMSTHGMTSSNTTVLVDGMMVNGLQSDGSVQSYFNDAMNQEVSYQTSGIGAETQAGGVRLNLIPREGGNRFNGDFKAAYRPGEWQSDNLTQRHLDKQVTTGNATDRIIDFTFSQGGPIMKDKLWFFGSARYFSVNNYILDTYFDDGSAGVDDQLIKSAMLRLTWQMSSKMKFSGYFDEVDKYRGHDMQALNDPEEAAVVWNSPAYSTGAGKISYTATSRLLFEGGYSRNLEYYTYSYQDGIGQPRYSPEWYSGVSREEVDLGGRKSAGPYEATRSPARHAWNASGAYVTGSHNFKAGAQMTWGTFGNTLDSNGHLNQRYRSNATGVPYSVPDTVLISNYPLSYSNRLNYDIGIYAQDSWTIKRLTVNAGVRFERLKAQVLASEAEAGRFVPARTFPAIEDLPNWKGDWAPRLAAVYDLFGNAKTAIKYSLNKYNQSRTTGIAGNYNPLLEQTFSLPWRDVSGDDIAQGERGCTGYPRVGCEINFNTLPPNFGIRALNEYGEYPRTYNVEHGAEIQHELFPQLSVTGSWFHGNFHDLTTTLNQSWVYNGNPLDNPNYTPFTVYDPRNGDAITVYGRTAAATALPTLNLDTVDPDAKRIYNAYAFEFRARPGRGAQFFGGFAFERQQDVNCAASDNPNSLRFCDDRENGLPYRKQLKLNGSYPAPWGITLSASFQSVQGGTSTRGTTGVTVPATADYLAITRNSTTYPATCPAPCPAGGVILPVSFNPGTFNLLLEDEDAKYSERINQLDFKVQKNFTYGRTTISPVFEVFNATNSDTIITYVTSSVLNAAYLRPNSILQGRMIGVGANVRW